LDRNDAKACNLGICKPLRVFFARQNCQSSVASIRRAQRNRLKPTHLSRHHPSNSSNHRLVPAPTNTYSEPRIPKNRCRQSAIRFGTHRDPQTLASIRANGCRRSHHPCSSLNARCFGQ
jgi:hypothetical protein